MVYWDGLPTHRTSYIYKKLTDILPVYGQPTQRKCEYNDRLAINYEYVFTPLSLTLYFIIIHMSLFLIIVKHAVVRDTAKRVGLHILLVVLGVYITMDVNLLGAKLQGNFD